MKISIEQGLELDYFVDDKGFSRGMVELADKQGVIWIEGLCVVPDRNGKEKMLCSYSRRKGLNDPYESGIAVFDEAAEVFRSTAQLPLDETWRLPTGHAVVRKIDGKDYVTWGNPFLHVCVPLRLDSVLDPKKYESWTCLPDDGNPKTDEPLRDAKGTLAWRWTTAAGPVTPKIEARWLKSGKIQPDEAVVTPRDADGKAVEIHTGTTHWNPFRKKWILLGCEIHGQTSHLGEVWYAESDSPQGPFRNSVKVVTHDRYTFYNVCQHDFLDTDDGRYVYFEGTYTKEFSGNPHATPRYDYNQIMYRLDLDRHEIKALTR
ncbi:MAG: hypothetical protein QM811_14815 [Pirellulales bacterium]